MWQALYWEKWWDGEEPEEEGKKNYVRVKDKEPHEALEPFHRVEDETPTSWTSDACRDWTIGGYTYDDLIPPDTVLESENGPLNEDFYKRYLRVRIMNLYYSTEDVARKLRAQTDPAALFGADAASREGAFQDYIINVLYDRYALDGLSYSIRFYLSRYAPGDVSTSSIEASENDFIGEVYSFGGSSPATSDRSSCANCKTQQKAGILSKAQVPITVPLLLLAITDEVRAISKVNRNNVGPFLKRNLSWKFVCYGEEVGAEHFPQTDINVYAGLSKSAPVPTEETSLSLMGDMDETYSTPSFGSFADGQYRKLFDAMQERQNRLNPETQDTGPVSLSMYAETQYSEDDW